MAEIPISFIGLGSGGGVISDDVTATQEQVLAGYTALTADSNNKPIAGAMPNIGSYNRNINASVGEIIPRGYHDGTGQIIANSLSSQTTGNASAGQILNGQIAWVNGARIAGTMPNRGAVTANVNAGASYTIPAGYHNGSGRVTGNTLASQTSGNATTAQILSGRIAWSNGARLVGTMPNVAAIDPAKSVVLSSGTLYARMTNGAHISNATSGFPEVSVPQATLASAITLTAPKLVKGNTVLGIAGTAPYTRVVNHGGTATINIPLNSPNTYVNLKNTGEYLPTATNFFVIKSAITIGTQTYDIEPALCNTRPSSFTVVRSDGEYAFIEFSWDTNNLRVRKQGTYIPPVLFITVSSIYRYSTIV